MPKRLVAQFEEDSGYDLEIVPNGDAGQLTNKLVLTKDAPIADAVYGIDNTFATRALDEGVLAAAPPGASPPAPSGYAARRRRGRAARRSTGATSASTSTTPGSARTTRPAGDPRRPDRAGVQGPLRRPRARRPPRPGFAFLLATVAKYGDGRLAGLLARLVANGVRVTSGWTDAYEVDFTAGGPG